MSLRFAHLADVHLGAWRDPRLASLPSQAFDFAIKESLRRKADFILVAGDLFHSALPGIDFVRDAARSLRLAKKAGVPVYVIPGSHDFSPSGKSMIHVLEEAGLLVNVFQGEVVDGRLRLKVFRDEKTGVAIAGILGRKGSLDRLHYEELDYSSLSEAVSSAPFSIFLFHSAIDELKPKDLSLMSSNPLSLLPKGFDYYAGGHVHVVGDISLPDYKMVVYPGPLFPANFYELEKLNHGGMVFYDSGSFERIPVLIKRVVSFSLTVDDSPEVVSSKLLDLAGEGDFSDAIVLLRISGSLKSGSVSDIDFRSVLDAFYSKGAFVVLRNTSSLKSEVFSSSLPVNGFSPEKIEEEIFSSVAGDVVLSKKLARLLSSEKRDGESKSSFEDRLLADARSLLGVDVVDDSY